MKIRLILLLSILFGVLAGCKEDEIQNSYTYSVPQQLGDGIETATNK